MVKRSAPVTRGMPAGKPLNEGGSRAPPIAELGTVQK